MVEPTLVNAEHFDIEGSASSTAQTEEEVISAIENSSEEENINIEMDEQQPSSEENDTDVESTIS